MYDVIILGGGAAGLMAAAHLKGRRVLLVERNARPGAKIAVSGGGRCNFTNARLDASCYLGEERFVQRVLDAFDNEALLSYFASRGLDYEERKGGQYFCRRSARDLLAILEREAAHALVWPNTTVEGAQREAAGFCVTTSRGEARGRTLLVATGGPSFPKLGASDLAWGLAESFGLPTRPPAPALVGLTLQKEQAWMKALAGLSLRVAIAVGRRRLEGELLFAHRGITGPAVLDASLFWRKGSLTIDFLPGRRLKPLLARSRRSALHALPLPRRFLKAFFEALRLPAIPYDAMGEEQKQRLSLLKSYPLAPAGTFGFHKAEVSKGGVLTDALESETMRSRDIPGLFFAGEGVDVTGRLGGYNFQWAFSSGFVAARGIAASLE
ncbi:NAD(P)/FAD-dependent oxidoreductase [Hydrogenimonas sp.]